MNPVEKENYFKEELSQLINKYSYEFESSTADFILAKFMFNCLQAYEYAVKDRDHWYGFAPWPKEPLNEKK